MDKNESETSTSNYVSTTNSDNSVPWIPIDMRLSEEEIVEKYPRYAD